MGETMDATVTSIRGFPFLLRFSSRAWIYLAGRPVQRSPSSEKNSRQGRVSANGEGHIAKTGARDATSQPIGQRPTVNANTNRIGNAYILHFYKYSQFTEFIQAQYVTKAELLRTLYFYTVFTPQNF